MNPAPAPKAALRWRVYTSRVVLGWLFLGFATPVFCFCPGFYLFSAGVALIPLFCGPRLYRVLAVLAIGYALFAAHRDYEGQLRERAFIKELRSRREHQQQPTQPDITPTPSPSTTPVA